MGYDWSKIMTRLDYVGTYGDVTMEFVRSFAMPKTCLTSWTGSYANSTENMMRLKLWEILLHGGDNIAWWIFFPSRCSGGVCAFTSDFEPLPWLTTTKKELNTIKLGYDKLLLNSKRENDPIAIHYSTRSAYASTMRKFFFLPPLDMYSSCIIIYHMKTFFDKSRTEANPIRRNRNFTIVELLVVIGIILILLSMLMPALRSAKMKAQGVYCQNNLKQIGLATQTYASDSDGYAIRACVKEYSYGGSRWDVILVQNGYLGNAKPDYIYNMSQQVPTLNCPLVTNSNVDFPNYMISIAFPYPDWDGFKYPWKRFSQLNPHTMYFTEQQGEDDSTCYNGRLAYYGTPYGHSGRNFGNFSTLHNKGANALFVGGNVGNVKFLDLTNPSWNGWDGYP